MNDIIELFEDVEGISIKPFEDWKFSQYFVTTDSSIQSILASKRIAVGLKFYPVIECPKILVQSKGGEDLEPQVVTRVMFRSCGFTLLSCVKEEPAQILKFYCPQDIMEKLCQVEHRIKGKDVIVIPDPNSAMLSEPQQHTVVNTPPPIVEHGQISPPVVSPSPSAQAVERPLPAPLPIPEPPKVNKCEEYSVSIIHDGQNCPANRTITPSQLRDGILNLVWKALTGRSEMVQQDQLSIFVKWNFILSPTKIHQFMPPADSTFYQDLVPLGARLIDPGPCSKGVKNMFLEILSDYLSSFSSRSSNMNHHEVVLLICHADQDYVDIVRLMRNLGAKVMLIHSEVIWSESSQQFQSLAGGSKMGLRAILPRHYVLGIWEDIIGLPDSKKVGKETHSTQGGSSSVSSNLITQEKSNLQIPHSPNPKSPSADPRLASSSSTENLRKRQRDDLIPPSISSTSKIRGVEETYGSRNCSWCLEYYGANCMLHGKSGHSSRDCWFSPKKKNTEECCSWCWRYIGRKFRHKTINCWNLECPWCRKHHDERCFHHIENCPKVKQSKERQDKSISSCPPGANSSASISASGSSSKQPSIPKPKEPTSSPQPKKIDIGKPSLLKDNISVIDECWKDDMQPQQLQQQGVEKGESSSARKSAPWVEDRVGNRKEDHIELPTSSSGSASCSWCLEYLSMDLDHSIKACPYQFSKKARDGCLWCHIHLGVKLTHELAACPNRLERQMKDKEPEPSEVTLLHLDLTPSTSPSLPIKPISPKTVPEREIKVKTELPPEKKMKILDPRLRVKVEEKIIQEPEVGEIEERAPDSCEWCWSIRRVQRVHGLDECDLAPRPRGNTKPTSSSSSSFAIEPKGSPPLENFDEEMELEDSIQWGDEDHCVRCWDNLRIRRYHALSDCPYAPTPKGNQKPAFPNNDEFGSEEDLDADPVITISIDRSPATTTSPLPSATPPPPPSPSPHSLDDHKKNEETNLSSTKNEQQTRKPPLEICKLCWEHHRQRKYHDHPSDCRTIHKMRKNHKKWT
jgi:hypothetical protein